MYLSVGTYLIWKKIIEFIPIIFASFYVWIVLSYVFHFGFFKERRRQEIETPKQEVLKAGEMTLEDFLFPQGRLHARKIFKAFLNKFFKNVLLISLGIAIGCSLPHTIHIFRWDEWQQKPLLVSTTKIKGSISYFIVGRPADDAMDEMEFADSQEFIH